MRLQKWISLIEDSDHDEELALADVSVCDSRRDSDSDKVEKLAATLVDQCPTLTSFVYEHPALLLE